MKPFHERPLACKGSGHAAYRYRGRYGWIMAAASTHHEAEREVRRSLSGEFDSTKLEVWDGEKYRPARGFDNPPKF